MNRKIIAGLVALSLWGASAMTAVAADPLLLELYGSGVHAFHANKYNEAHELLSEAIDQGSRDPRVFYYRGLVYARTGRPELAEKDIKEAALLEVTNDSEIYNVGKALERIQGSARLSIERQRRSARVAVVRQQARVDKARYEEAEASEERVIRRRGAPVAGTPAVRSAAPAGNDPTPFDNGLGVGDAEMAPERPMVAEEPAGAAADPFGAGPAPMPAPGRPAAPAGDPFGKAPAPAPMPKAPAADPFGEAPAPAPAPMAEADDPFGDAPAAPAPLPPAPKPPAPKAEADDPFGDAPAADPAAPPANDPATPATEPAMPADPPPADPAPAADPAAPAPAPAPAADPFGDDPAPAPADPAAPAPAEDDPAAPADPADPAAPAPAPAPAADPNDPFGV